MKKRLMAFLTIIVCLAMIGCINTGSGQDNSGKENNPPEQTAKAEETLLDNANTNVNNEQANISTGNKPETKTVEEKESPEEKPALVLGSLKKVVSDGCSCSVRDPADRSKNSVEPKLLFIADLDNDSPAYLNINGKDTKFSLLKRGNRPNDANSKTPYEDVYETDGMIAKIRYVFSKSGCPKGEECESSEFDVTITIIKDKEVVTKTAKGICGC